MSGLSFEPDWIVAPGDILSEYLDVRGIDRAAFASRCGLSIDDLTAVGIGAAAIDQELADAFARELDGPASLWLNLEAFYRHQNAVQGAVDSRVEMFVREARTDTFRRRDFAQFGRDGHVNTAIDRLLNDGTLVRVGRGLYAKPGRTA